MKEEPEVEVFKTNVKELDQAMHLTKVLQLNFPGSRIVFDLDDCDKILKLEGGKVQTDEVRKLLAATGFTSEVLV